ncbi:uncharacterized protein LOC130962924 [Arachis stenosperma]|uniref:uncharacterized protein LOC130962924 n=1 Tax=Arachis stenosperma TaxID=217475 RepID=UPI0025ACA2CC|nr:uncharacterized protein LOC130962924 [Arachis stenosperma]
MNRELISEVTEEEIRKAVFSMGSLKAPGPDGLNGLFYQKHWEIIKKEVCAVVREFFRNGFLPEDISETIVVLIPKVKDLEELNQLRLISCCNFIYKIITMVIVLRLKGLLEDIVSPTQSAFVGGRLIQDNVVIVQEVYHSLNRKGRDGSQNVAIKLDMNKAYDRLEWDFLEKVLMKFGFAEKWVDLVMKCVRSQAKAKDNITGLKIAPTAPAITHLLFADDCIIFAKAKEEEIFQIITENLHKGRKILVGSIREERGIHWKKWDSITESKTTGKKGASWVWRSILHGRELLRKCVKWSIGDGSKVSIWKDNWIAERSSPLNTNSTDDSKVKDLIVNGEGWNKRKIESKFSQEIFKEILSTPVSVMNKDDHLYWPWREYGNYSIRTGYYAARRVGQNSKYGNPSTSEDKREIWKEVWRMEVPQKIRMFLWKACHDILPVGSNLYKRKMAPDPVCQICLKCPETVEHALLLCDWARATWFGAECQWTPTVETVSSIGNWMVECIKKLRAGGGEDQKKRISKLGFLMWEIWKTRNNKLFQ